MNLNEKPTGQEKPKKKIKKRNYFFLNFVKATGFPAVLYYRPKILCYGKTRPKDIKGGAIVVANHTSFFDPIFGYCVFWRRNLHLVATKDLFAGKLKNFFFKSVHCIEVDKENFSMKCFYEIQEVLENDKLVMIFPEGRLNLDNPDKMLAFKSGTVLMAHRANKPIIPLYIVKGKKWYNRWHGVIGDPIDVREMCGPLPSLDKINEVCALLKQKEEELRDFYLRSKKK